MFSLDIPEALLTQMLRQCRESLPAETGGILAGYYTRDLRTAVVTDLLAPPQDSTEDRARFVRGSRGLVDRFKQLWQKPRRVYYLGEWHSHPGGPRSPSGNDRDSMLAIARTPSEKCPEPILLVVGRQCKSAGDIGVTVFTRDGQRLPLEPTG